MELPVHHTDWLLGILLLSVVLALAARLYNPERFRAFAGLPFHVKRPEMESAFNPAAGRGLFDVSLSVLSYLVLSLAVYLWLHRNGEAPPLLNDAALFYRVLLVLVVFFLLKNLAGLFIGWVFGRTEEIAHSQNTQLAHRSWLALILLPLVILAVFNAGNFIVWHWLLLIFTLAGLSLSLYFSFRQLWQIGTYSYYKILYLCALEITPLLFLAGWLKSLNQ